MRQRHYDTRALLQLAEATEDLLMDLFEARRGQLATPETITRIADTIARLTAVRKTLCHLYEVGQTTPGHPDNSKSPSPKFDQIAADINEAIATTQDLFQSNTPNTNTPNSPISSTPSNSSISSNSSIPSNPSDSSNPSDHKSHESHESHKSHKSQVSPSHSIRALSIPGVAPDRLEAHMEKTLAQAQILKNDPAPYPDNPPFTPHALKRLAHASTAPSPESSASNPAIPVPQPPVEASSAPKLMPIAYVGPDATPEQIIAALKQKFPPIKPQVIPIEKSPPP